MKKLPYQSSLQFIQRPQLLWNDIGDRKLWRGIQWIRRGPTVPSRLSWNAHQSNIPKPRSGVRWKHGMRRFSDYGNVASRMMRICELACIHNNFALRRRRTGLSRVTFLKVGWVKIRKFLPRGLTQGELGKIEPTGVPLEVWAGFGIGILVLAPKFPYVVSIPATHTRNSKHSTNSSHSSEGIALHS